MIPLIIIYVYVLVHLYDICIEALVVDGMEGVGGDWDILFSADNCTYIYYALFIVISSKKLIDESKENHLQIDM